MIWNSRKRKAKVVLRKIKSHIAPICQLRTADAPPIPGAREHIAYLKDVVDQIETAMRKESVREAVFGAGTEEELTYLRHALDQLEQYHSPSGVQSVGNDNVRIYIFFIQSKMMTLCRTITNQAEWEGLSDPS